MFQTERWHVDARMNVGELVNHPAVQLAVGWVKQDFPVAFPTETVYGLGANSLSSEAVRRIFEVKGRPLDNPLIVHIHDPEMLNLLVRELPPVAVRLMSLFWPGPLTLILPARASIPQEVTAGLPTVAVRMPDHPVALALIAAGGTPLAAPSANRSGRPSPTTAEHVLADLDGLIPGILDAGETPLGVESTVLDVTEEVPVILRPGGMTLEQLKAAIGEVVLDPALAAIPTQRVPKETSRNRPLQLSPSGDQSRAVQENGTSSKKTSDITDISPEAVCAEAASAAKSCLKAAGATDAPRSPGLKYMHYAPQGEMWLVCGEEEAVIAQIVARAGEKVKQGVRTGILTTEENKERYWELLHERWGGKVSEEVLIVSCGRRQDLSSVAHGLYGALRRFDDQGMSYILSESFPEEGMGLAVMNRLYKASGGKVWHVKSAPECF